jgi:hypothetical protein
MSGPLPKPAGQRRRRNRSTTATTLQAVKPFAVPVLAVEEAHPSTVAFWDELWASPITPELTNVDLHGLAMLAELVEDFHRASSATARVKLSQEIRLRGAEFGLSPISRRRLQWEIAKVNEAEDRRARRAKSAEKRPDPRLVAGI